MLMSKDDFLRLQEFEFTAPVSSLLPLVELHQFIDSFLQMALGRLFFSLQIVDERDKSDKLWELLTTLHENPPKADHGKTVSTTTRAHVVGYICVLMHPPGSNSVHMCLFK